MEAVEAATGNAGQPTGSDVVLQHGQALVLQIFHLRAVLQPGHLWGISHTSNVIFFICSFKEN